MLELREIETARSLLRNTEAMQTLKVGHCPAKTALPVCRRCTATVDATAISNRHRLKVAVIVLFSLHSQGSDWERYRRLEDLVARTYFDPRDVSCRPCPLPCPSSSDISRVCVRRG